MIVNVPCGDTSICPVILQYWIDYITNMRRVWIGRWDCDQWRIIGILQMMMISRGSLISPVPTPLMGPLRAYPIQVTTSRSQEQ